MYVCIVYKSLCEPKIVQFSLSKVSLHHTPYVQEIVIIKILD